MKSRKHYCILCFLIVSILMISISDASQDNTSDVKENNKGPLGDNSADGNQGQGQLRTYYLWIVIIVIIAIVIPLSYYLISRNMKHQMEKNMSLISQMVNNTPTQSVPVETVDNRVQYQKILLKFLNYNENLVMKKLIDNKGSLLQSEISRMPNMGKVKAHRILNDMKTKGLIRIEPHGKTNYVSLSD
ncbi:MAG: hypothetical protein V1769_00185, partial [Thermoplasmatota archaeon]